MAALEALLKIKAETTGGEKVVALRQGLASLGQAGKTAESGLKGLGGAVSGLSGLAGALAPLLSVAGIMALGSKAIETGNKLNDMAQKTGVSVTALAKFSKAAALNGADLDTVAKGLGKLSKGMMDAATTGSGPAASALKLLGISAVDASGRLRGADAVMLQIADRFKTMPDGATKTALAIQLFGKAGAELIPMLNQGGEAIDKLSVKMTTEFAAKANQFNDNMIKLSGTVNGLGMTVADVLLPTLISLSDELINYAKKVVGYIESNKAQIETVMRWINAFATGTGMLIKATIEQVGAFARVLGRLSVLDFAGAFDEAKQYMANFVGQAGKDFQQLGAIINGTGTQAAGAVSAVSQRTLELTNAQELAKEKQAQWKSWVDQTEASYRQMQFTISQAEQVAAGQMKILDARLGAELAINNAAKNALQTKLNTAKTDVERLAITRQIAAVDIQNARIQLQLAKAQIAAEVQQVVLKLQSAKVAEAQARATLAEARARGVVTDQYEQALSSQINVVRQTETELGIARQVAYYKGISADKAFEVAQAAAQASISSAELRNNQASVASSSGIAANNIRGMATEMGRVVTLAEKAASQSFYGVLGSSGEGEKQVTRRGLGIAVASGNMKQDGRISLFATGGVVNRATLAMVGEGGEREYIVPESKMGRASAAYLAGARGAAVLGGATQPRQAAATSSASGRAAPTINITTGPVLEFDGQRYAKLEDLERAMRLTAEGVIGRLRTPAARIALGIG